MGFDFRTLPRCGAKVRGKKNSTCQQAAMANGRCYLHGGKSTEPRTKEGLERMRKSKIKHGRYTQDAVRKRKEFRKKLISTKYDLDRIIKNI